MPDSLTKLRVDGAAIQAAIDATVASIPAYQRGAFAVDVNRDGAQASVGMKLNQTWSAGAWAGSTWAGAWDAGAGLKATW